MYEKVKRIWSKILAGEAKKPNSFSLRTLSILGNLSKEEALLFSKCCSVMILNFIPNELDLLNRYGLKYNDILKMDDCGLINSSGTISARIEIGSKNKEIFYNNDYILFGSCEKNKVLNLSEFIFTAAGRELSTIVCNDSNFNFILDYSKLIHEENKEISISLHKVNYIKGDKISYEDNNLLDDCHE